MALLPLLALTAACGTPSGGETSKRNSTSPEVSATGSRETGSSTTELALTQNQLNRLLLATDAVDGFIGSNSHQKPLRPRADRSECQPLADLTAVGTDRSPRAKAFAARGFAGSNPPASEGDVLTVALLSFEKEGARDTIERIRSALSACGDAFKTSGNAQGRTLSYSNVVQRNSFADSTQSIMVRMVLESGEMRIPMDIQVVAVGSTIAQFLAMNIKDPAKGAVPEAAVSAQLDQLATATSR
ncbi:hypothetical protein ACFZAV_21355 [Streptomyces sp. NPDC008343]|uniref:hypothetical protein n=1 Tax=Streptomyces sp. NPDC008343 TaxID=3364828 RepID=UPI0036ED639C